MDQMMKHEYDAAQQWTTEMRLRRVETRLLALEAWQELQSKADDLRSESKREGQEL